MSCYAATPPCRGAKNGCQVEENGFLDCGNDCFLTTNTAQDRDAHWRVEQGGVVDLQHEFIGGVSPQSGTKYLAVTQRPALSRRPKMAALRCQIRRPEQQVLYLMCKAGGTQVQRIPIETARYQNSQSMISILHRPKNPTLQVVTPLKDG